MVKKWQKYLEDIATTTIFASLFNRKHISLSYGVMVAQQFLVLFVEVRIFVGQLKRREKYPIKRYFSFCFL